jgi:hypothetical protein|tara:strand:+ start:510 stop:884 length:375 start_codon:yes stop_codon:yes gene_type:complete
MIELFISTLVVTNSYEIARLMGEQYLECQVYSNVSSVITNNIISIENGYHIKFFNLKDEDFKEKVWNILQPKLNLECAYVKVDERYMGCIYNWPKVFTESNCKLCSVSKTETADYNLLDIENTN